MLPVIWPASPTARRFVASLQAAEEVAALIQRVSPAVVVLELDPERERKLLEQVRPGWQGAGGAPWRGRAEQEH